MACRNCRYYLDSFTANAPRLGLADYGYCKAVPDTVTRARLFHGEGECWLKPPKFVEEKRP
jgi:hypothetical protein